MEGRPDFYHPSTLHHLGMLDSRQINAALTDCLASKQQLKVLNRMLHVTFKTQDSI